jgi:CheY-like chemotaxis protein
MEEQEAGGRQILESVGRLKEISVSVKKGSENLSVTMGTVMEKAGEFMEVTSKVIGGMTEITTGAMSEITATVKHVDEMSAENNKNFTDLKKETEKFKISTGNEMKKILLVDDDPTHLTATSSILEKDYEIVTARSGHDALVLFYQGLVPHLVLLDLIMPGMDGWDTYERIRALSNLHHVPIAIFSASEDPQDRVRAQQMGAVDFIQKPAKKLELLEKIGKLIKS